MFWAYIIVGVILLILWAIFMVAGAFSVNEGDITFQFFAAVGTLALLAVLFWPLVIPGLGIGFILYGLVAVMKLTFKGGWKEGIKS